MLSMATVSRETRTAIAGARLTKQRFTLRPIRAQPKQSSSSLRDARLKLLTIYRTGVFHWHS